MNEGQGKPNEKRSGPWSLMLFSILLLVATLAAFVFSGFHESGEGEASYNTAREEMRNAVISYSVDHNGSFPTLSGTYTVTNCDNCSIVNVSALLTSNGGMLSTYPQGLYFSNITGMDNWNGNASLVFSNYGSYIYGSYIWLVDSTGNLYSYCAGARCKTNNSGYQGVWP